MIENRPWGSFEILLDESYTKVKKISVNCGGKLSLQYHNKRDEQWVIVSGSGILTKGDHLGRSGGSNAMKILVVGDVL